MFRRILVPVDGSPFSEAALSPALFLARAAGGEVRLLTVVEVPPIFVYPEFRSADREGAEGYLATLAGRAAEAGGATPGTVVREGYVAPEITREAAEWDADLIVMATHGRGGLSRLWLGSVADSALRHAERPMLMIRPPESGAAADDGLVASRVVVPVDGSERAEAALTHGLELARLLGVPLELLRVVTYIGAPEVALVPQTVEVNLRLLEEEQEAAVGYLDGWAGRLRADGARVSTRVVTDPRAAQAILKEADDDAVVMTTHGRGGLDRTLLGSVADKVVRGAAGPVLVIPPPPEES